MLTVSFVIQKHIQHVKLTHLCCFTSCSAFFLLPFLLLLLQLFNAFLQHIGPEITFKVRQLLGTCQPVLSRLFEDVLLSDTIPRTNKWRPLREMGEPERQSMLHWAAVLHSGPTAHSLQAFFSENSTKTWSDSSANSSLPASALTESCWGSPEPPSCNRCVTVQTGITLEWVTKPSLLGTPIKNQAPPLSFSYTASEQEQNQQQLCPI